MLERVLPFVSQNSFAKAKHRSPRRDLWERLLNLTYESVRSPRAVFESTAKLRFGGPNKQTSKVFCMFSNKKKKREKSFSWTRVPSLEIGKSGKARAKLKRRKRAILIESPTMGTGQKGVCVRDKGLSLGQSRSCNDGVGCPVAHCSRNCICWRPRADFSGAPMLGRSRVKFQKFAKMLWVGWSMENILVSSFSRWAKRWVTVVSAKQQKLVVNQTLLVWGSVPRGVFTLMTGPVTQLASAPSRAASLDPARFGGQKYSSLKPLECLDCITANKGVYNCRVSRSRNWLDCWIYCLLMIPMI